MNFLNSVQCTWKVPEGQKLLNALKITDSPNDSEDLEDSIQPQNCVLLSSPSASPQEDDLLPPSCQLRITCNELHEITSLSLLSEARIIEVYGHHGEYLSTLRTKLVEETEDICVFRGDLDLSHPLSVCSLKFTPLRSKNEMWLFGLKIQVQKRPPNFPFAEVERRLNEMGIKVNDKAESFHTLMESFALSNTNAMSNGTSRLDPLAQLLSLAATSAAPTPFIHQASAEAQPHPSAQKSTSDVSSPAQFVTSSRKSSSSSFTPPKLDLDPKPTPPPPPPLELPTPTEGSLLEEVLSDMERRITEHIDAKFQELDRMMTARIRQHCTDLQAIVMCKLEEIATAIKSHPNIN